MIAIIKRHANRIPVPVNVRKDIPVRSVKRLVRRDTMVPTVKRNVAVKMMESVIMFRVNVYALQGSWDHCKFNWIRIH